MKDLSVISTNHGFAHYGLMPTNELVFVKSYRKYCEDDICGNYNKHPMCPPMCGTFEELKKNVQNFKNVLVLQSIWHAEDFTDQEFIKKCKATHNKNTKSLINELNFDGDTGIIISAGPGQNTSCVSAYCIDVAEAAKFLNMNYYFQDNNFCLFSFFIFD
mgnify:CR=1 FL=1